jgi:hypothetical protein
LFKLGHLEEVKVAGGSNRELVVAIVQQCQQLEDELFLSTIIGDQSERHLAVEGPLLLSSRASVRCVKVAGFMRLER